MAVVRVAFIGAGGNASGHMKRVKELVEDTEIVAICDVDAERAKKATEEFGGTPYRDHHEMLDKEAMDALYISVPPFAHDDAEIIAAGKGIHLFVEKPVALSVEKGIEINEAIEKAGVISCVAGQGVAGWQDRGHGKLPSVGRHSPYAVVARAVQVGGADC